MPSQHHSSRAFTLVELIITIIIVAIMLGGILAMNMAVSRMDREVQGNSYLYTKTLAMAEHIRQNASRASGYQDDLGIRILAAFRDTSSMNNYLCIRVDQANTPSDLLDDVWVCYTHTGAAHTDLRTCEFPITAGGVPQACAVTDTLLGQIAFSTTVGAVNTFNATNPCFNDALNGCPGVFKFHLTTRTDPTAAVDTTHSGGTMNNPQVTIEYTVIPEAHSL